MVIIKIVEFIGFIVYIQYIAQSINFKIIYCDNVAIIMKEWIHIKY